MFAQGGIYRSDLLFRAMLPELKQGMVIGLAVSVPVGPIALLIMRRSLRDGKLAGWVSGLGAATADAIAGTIAALGLSAVMSLIEDHALLLRLFAGVVLILLGLHTLRARVPLDSKRPIHARNLVTAFFSTGALTLANPMTFFGMMFVSAAAGVGTRELTPVNTAFLITGILASSATWWLVLSTGAGWLGKRLGPNTLHVINLVAGAVIISIGVYQLAEVVSLRFFETS